MVWLFIFGFGQWDKGPFLLNEDLELGEGTMFAVSPDQHLFVLEPASCQVYVINPNFQVVHTFGRRGKGPGEIEEAEGIVYTHQKEIAVFDVHLKRVSYFSEKGDLLRMHPSDVGSVALYHPMVHGDAVTFLGARSHKGLPVYDLATYSSEGLQTKVHSRIEVPALDWSQSEDPNFWVSFLENELNLARRGLPICLALDETTFALAHPNENTLEILKVDGSKVANWNLEPHQKAMSEHAWLTLLESNWERITTDPYLGNRMPQKIFDRAFKRIEKNSLLPYVSALIKIQDGFAILTEYDSAKSQGVFIAFDKSGQEVSRSAYQGKSRFLQGQGNHLYSLELNADDFMIIQRYDHH